MFKNIKEFQKYLFAFVVLCVVVSITFVITSRYLTNSPKQDVIPAINGTSIRDAEVKIIHQELRQQSKDIFHLLEVVSSINKFNIYGDKYSRFLIPLMNIRHLLYTEYATDISIDVKAIQTLSKHDITLSQIFSKTLPQNVYGVKYFRAEFNKMVREVHSTQLSGDDTKFQHFVKKHIMPHVVYISPSGSHSSRIFHEAHLLLENGSIKEFYSILKEVDSTSKVFANYLKNLENFLLVESAIYEATNYIQGVIVQAETSQEDAQN